MQSLTITGRLGRDAEMRNAGQDQVCAFSVAVDQGYGDHKTTNWYRCSIWGRRGEKLRQHLTKGTNVAIQGELEIGEYQGKPQYDIRVNEVALMGGGDRQDRGNGTTSGNVQQQPYNAARKASELDDDVPF